MTVRSMRSLRFVAIAAALLAACAPVAPSLQTDSPEALVKTLGLAGTDSSAAEFELVGTIELMAPTAWTLNGKVLAILPATKLDGAFTVGDLVKAHAAIQPDGSIAAYSIEPMGSSSSSALSVLGAEYDFTGVIDAMAADEWTVAGTTFAVTAQTEIKGTFAVGELVKVHLLVGTDSSLVAREIEAPEDELETADEGDELEFVGVIESIGPASWVIGGQTLAISAQTEIDGTFAVGDAVKVHVFVGADGVLTAREIEAAEVDDMVGDDDSDETEIEDESENESEDESIDDHGDEQDDSGGSSESSGSGSGD